ncbi:MAG: fumarylacetoacetate hydrolase family protein [Ottowia sp.]|uniref:fumarylacetoacetate hydrolase family protein n=1 Tax=Ottowia sp. TaxID=1898956 RepID=UPI003C712458
MKLASYLKANGSRSFGALTRSPEGERLLDLRAAARSFEPGVEAQLGANLLELIRGGEQAMQAARRVLARVENTSGTDDACVHDLLDDPTAVTFLPPLEQPGKIIAIGANYPSHVEEIGDSNKDAAVAAIGKNLSSGEYPPAFAKLTSSLAGHRATIPYPAFTEQLDYEAELAFVIGEDCRHVAEADALSCIAGFTIANDVSARDVQFKEMKRGLLLLGKNFEASAPMGPYFVTRDEVANYRDIEIRCWVNGELRQQDAAGRMIHSIEKALSYYSKMPLRAGDIFLTGSPAGVAIGRPDPAKFLLRPGDVVEIEITGLGRLVNTIGERQ